MKKYELTQYEFVKGRVDHKPFIATVMNKASIRHICINLLVPIYLLIAGTEHLGYENESKIKGMILSLFQDDRFRLD